MTDTSAQLPIFFPIEHALRETDYRLWLAAQFASPTRRIFVGMIEELAALLPFTGGGLWVGQDLDWKTPPTLEARLRQRKAPVPVVEDRLRQQGATIVFVPEEGAIYPGGPDDWQFWLRYRLDPRTLHKEDFLCSWGAWQRDYYATFDPPCRQRLRVVGHPRFDLLRAAYRPYFEPEVETLRQQHGDFVLVNTNMAAANHALGWKRVFGKVDFRYAPHETDKRTFWINWWAQNNIVLSRFVALINRLSIEMPDVTIVVRPHPSESDEFYTTIFGDVPNVKVLREGSVVPWLLACRLLIHDGCTTGMEAHLAGTPIINYKAVSDERYDLFLPNLFGARCETEDAVVDATRRVLSGQSLPEQARDEAAWATAESLVENLKRETFPLLLQVLESAEAQARQKPFGWDAAGHSKASRIAQGKESLRPLVKSFRRTKAPRPGLDAGEAGRRLSRIGGMVGKRLSCEAHGKNLISVSVQ